jgi:hypothetical protein
MFFPQSKTLITVPKAISVGKWRVLYTPFIFLFIAVRIVMPIIGRQQNVPTIILGIIGMCAFALLYWSIAVGRWRVWAFSNVSEIRWLYQRATVEHILPSDSFFKKLEWKTDAQGYFWIEIERQLDNGQTTKTTLEDYELPAETRVFISKWQFWWIPLVSIFVFGGIYFSINYIFSSFDKNGESKALLVLTPIMILIIAKEWWKGVKTLFSKLEPEIILSNEGVEMTGLGKKKWSEIEQIQVNTEGYGDERNDKIELHYLTGTFEFTCNHPETYDAENEKWEEEYWEEIDETTYEANKSNGAFQKHPLSIYFTKDIQSLTESPSKLAYLIKIYQSRGTSNRRINFNN